MFGRRRWFRSLSYLSAIGLSALGANTIRCHYFDSIEGIDAFSVHTREQMKRSRFSGMHEPFLSRDDEQLALFRQHFSTYTFLLPSSIDEMKTRHALQTPVSFHLSRSLLTTSTSMSSETLVVGGPPALISAVSLIKREKNLIYINDQRRIPIWFGSAWHLEEDAQSEGPTNYNPYRFLVDQVRRLLVPSVTYGSVEKTGEFPWRTIDWLGWFSHPEHWYRALKIFVLFQWQLLVEDRTELMNDVAKQCFVNEQFFERLNEELNGTVLLQDRGSIIVARNNDEVRQLNTFRANLEAEKRTLRLFSADEFLSRYSFKVNGLLLGEKIHDRVLVADFDRVIKEYLAERGGTLIDGTLEKIFVDGEHEGGVAQVKRADGKEQRIGFSRLILSLGNQPIFDENNRRLFDVVAARGVSILAHVYLRKGSELPAVLVCGGTNHVTRLSSQPISFDASTDLYLVRLTAGACITPNVSDERTSSYDGTIAFGLVKAVEQTLGQGTRVEPLLVYGCNRQVTRHGQIQWMQPFANIFIQYGAAGGGLTRAPDLITQIDQQEHR